MKIKHSESYSELRRAAYLPIGDQLDAIYKGIKSLEESGVEIPRETKEWINQCTKVKQDIKKPVDNEGPE